MMRLSRDMWKVVSLTSHVLCVFQLPIISLKKLGLQNEGWWEEVEQHSLELCNVRFIKLRALKGDLRSCAPAKAYAHSLRSNILASSSCVEASDGAIALIIIMCGHISAFPPLLSNDLDNLGERFTNFVHVPVSHSIVFDSYVSLGLRKFLYGS